MTVYLTDKLAKKIGDMIGVDWNKISLESLIKGINVESEHKDAEPNPRIHNELKDWIFYAKIAHAHLKESPRYYIELEKMENNLKLSDFIPKK
jgi:hypothetical protein